MCIEAFLVVDFWIVLKEANIVAGICLLLPFTN
jgi:hypothetical protein